MTKLINHMGLIPSKLEPNQKRAWLYVENDTSQPVVLKSKHNSVYLPSNSYGAWTKSMEVIITDGKPEEVQVLVQQYGTEVWKPLIPTLQVAYTRPLILNPDTINALNSP